MDRHPLKHIIEAALLTAGRPLSMQHLQQLLGEDDEDQTPLAKEFVQAGLNALSTDLEDRGVELKLVASGYRLQVRQSLEPWIARLFEERPPRYSRALLETLALIGYRQPITRAEIEDVRGVSVSSNIIRTLLEREWIKVVGHRDVPGRPSMYGTTKQFLDYFNLKSLSELPELGQLMDLDKASAEFDKANGNDAANDGEEGEQNAETEGGETEQVEETATEDVTTPNDQQDAQANSDVGSDAELNADADVAAEQSGEQQSAVSESEPCPADAADSNSADTGAERAADTADAEVETPLEEIEEASSVQGLADEELADGETQENIDADVESLIRMLDAEAGNPPATSTDAVTPSEESSDAVPETAPETNDSNDESSQHEAARGESITPADLLRRHSTDFEH